MSFKDELDRELAHIVGPISASELESHQLKFYKLDSDLCKSRSNRNCQSNARCLRGLGQHSWLTNPNEDGVESDDCEQKGRLGPFCGLKNLGATCYINTFLQLWFHNSKLRNAIYNWRPNNCTNILEHPITCLQLVMSSMQFSHRPFIDPSPFIKSLSLDESLEQDTHEFANLFITYVQNRMTYESDKSIQNTIDEQYRMEISYNIQCKNCHFESSRDSHSHELFLRVKGFKTIYDCIEDYLKDQHLVEPNQYACPSCGCLQDAIQRTRLRKLPPIVNLQLLRFESTNGVSKKINSFLKFPDQLNMAKYVNSHSSNHMYNLSAVLIHEGPTSYSGHYITYIKRDNFWYKFNDECVEKLNDFKLKIDTEEELGTEKKTKGEKEKDEKGVYRSKNAYMLVYRLASESETSLESSPESCNLPLYLTNHLDIDNTQYVREREEFLHNKKLRQMHEQEHRALVKETYKTIEVSKNSRNKMEAINKSWLNSWFSAKVKEDVKSVENQGLLCVHEKLDMDKAFKCISETAANVIAAEYGMDLRIPLPDLLCNVCTKYRIYITRLKQMMDFDYREISNSHKFKNNSNERMFWIGKESFKKWRSIKLNLLKRRFFPAEMETAHLADDEIETFNDDIICEHGSLCSDASKRRLVNQFVLNIFRKYFPDFAELDENTPQCNDCLAIDKRNLEIEMAHCDMASRQKECLQKLLDGDTEQSWASMQSYSLYYFMSVAFYNEWKKFVKHPTSEQLTLNPTDGILCDHMKFLFPLYDNDYIGFDKSYICLTVEEWDKFNEFYHFGNCVTFRSTNDSIEVSPEFCAECFRNYTNEERTRRFTYEKTVINVKLVARNSEMLNDDDDSSLLASKKIKLDNEVVTPNGTALRRSQRKRKQKNSINLAVSSNNKLVDIKSELFRVFNIAPYDQNLYYNSTLIRRCRNQDTLGEIGIEPSATLYLKVDDETNVRYADELTDDDNAYYANIIAEAGTAGFHGTQLAHL